MTRLSLDTNLRIRVCYGQEGYKEFNFNRTICRHFKRGEEHLLTAMRLYCIVPSKTAYD
jgi:hypothetical protein